MRSDFGILIYGILCGIVAIAFFMFFCPKISSDGAHYKTEYKCVQQERAPCDEKLVWIYVKKQD